MNRIGNLKLITGQLNASYGNDPWAAKREALQEHSSLRLNAELDKHEAWNEQLIQRRGERLAELIEIAWPGPDSTRWDS